MKKIILCLALAVTSMFMFAVDFKTYQNYVEKFLAKGTYVKIILDDSDIVYYYPKNSITELEYKKSGYNGSVSYIVNRLEIDDDTYEMLLDENNNIIYKHK